MRIAINGNRHQEGHFDEINELVTAFLQRGDSIVMSERFLNYLTDNLGERFALGIDYLPLTKVPNADLAISIGGDGAFLKTAHWIGNQQTPIAGINTGHLGYLSAFSFEHKEEIYNTLLQGNVRMENRSLLQIDIINNGKITDTLTALNELAITRGDNSAMLNITTNIDNISSLTYAGDGLIIATPTGSTAYNLSVGGPILDPSLAGWVLSPIAAHTLSIRPLVVKDQSVINFTVNTRGSSYRVTTDGKSITLPLSATLRVTKAPYHVNLIVQPDHAFVDTLRDKLGLGTTLK